MPDEPDMTSTPCDAPCAEHAQITLIETIQRCGIWNDECNQAAVVFVRAMVEAGQSEDTISKELSNLGLSTKGTIALIHEVQTAENLSGTEEDVDEAVGDRSGLRLMWGIVLAYGLLLAVPTTIVWAVKLQLVGAEHWVLIGLLFAGAIGYIVAYIRK